jgi:hypothetical protein
VKIGVQFAFVPIASETKILVRTNAAGLVVEMKTPFPCMDMKSVDGFGLVTMGAGAEDGTRIARAKRNRPAMFIKPKAN